MISAKIPSKSYNTLSSVHAAARHHLSLNKSKEQ